MFGEINLDVWFAEAKQDGNPYLTAWLAVMADEQSLSRLFMKNREAWQQEFHRRCQEGITTHAIRETLVGKYAWAVPCESSLSVLSKLAPLIEVGAGTGYWAWLLRKRGVDIIAFDIQPPGENSGNHYHKENPCFIDVKRGGPEVVNGHADRTLFLCWPPYDDGMALKCLERYKGRNVVFIGEGHGGCTADDKFFEMLESDFSEIEDVMIPQFDGLHDYMTVWQRNSSCTTEPSTS